MKVAYLGSLISSDSEFPLIRELQKRNPEFLVYFPAEGVHARGGVFSLKLFHTDAVIPASEYEEFKRYKEYFDISRIFIINNYHRKIYDIRSWIVWLKFMIHVKKQNATILHFTWPFRRQRIMLFFFGIKKTMTVHDPIPHSSQITRKENFLRRWSFRNSKRLLLLSNVLKEEFISRYNISREKVYLSRFGYYDWMDYCSPGTIAPPITSPYIVFCGQIQAHKGVDVLLKSMLEVHKVIPSLKCIVAGSGKYYFDIEPYKKLDYIEIRNYFVEMDEMINLVKNSIFTVCPYKDATQSGIVQISLSAGTPMIVTNVGALPIAVKDGETGIVVPPSDVNALSEAIIRLSKDVKLRDSFKNNIENIWKKQQGWKEVADDYLGMYESLE